MSDTPRPDDAPRADDSPAVLWVSLLTIALLAIVAVVIVSRRPPPAAPDDSVRLAAAVARIGEGKEAYREWARAQQAGQASPALRDQALHALQEGVEALSAVLLQPQYVDAEGFTKPEYEGYESEMSEAAQLIIDLEKASSLQ